MTILVLLTEIELKATLDPDSAVMIETTRALAASLGLVRPQKSLASAIGMMAR